MCALYDDRVSAVEVLASFRGVPLAARCLRGGPRRARFLIGSARAVDAPVAPGLIDDDAHALVTSGAGGVSVNVTPRMTGEVIFEDRRVSLAEYVRAHGASFAAPPRAELRVGCGDVAFVVRPTAAPDAVPRPAVVDRDSLAWLAVSAIPMLLLVALAAFVPPDPRAISGDGDFTLRRPVWVTPPEPPPPPPAKELPRGARDGGSSGAAPSARPRRTLRAGTPRPAAQPISPSQYANLGIVGLLGRYRGAVFERDSALDAVGALADLQGTGTASAYDANGFRPVGSDAGPGGPLVGIGELRTGRGIYGIPDGRAARLAPRKVATVPEVIPGGTPNIRGALDREIVRRVVRQHLNEVRFCYMQALPRNPKLAGRVVAHFAILANGTTSAVAIAESTLGDVRVEGCIAQAVRRWEFPRPSGAGLALVSYPFVLTTPGVQ